MFFLALLFITLNLLDISTTHYALSLGYKEANHITAYLIDNNLWVAIKITLMIIIVIGALLSRHIKIFKIIFVVLLIVINLTLLIAVINNIIVLINK